jgi:hypothetical protein
MSFCNTYFSYSSRNYHYRAVSLVLNYNQIALVQQQLWNFKKQSDIIIPYLKTGGRYTEK